MDNVLVTGASGFIGSSLCESLVSRGHRVHALLRPKSSTESLERVLGKLEIFRYDGIEHRALAQYLSRNSVDSVVHLASLFRAEHAASDVNGLIDSNVKFGAQLLDAMAIAGTSRLINTGTAWQHYHSSEYSPVCLYAATKEAFEKLLEFYVEARGMGVITLKLFDTYGETDTRPKLINLLRERSRSGERLAMSPGAQPIDIVHVSDVVRAFELALAAVSRDTGHKKYAVSSGTPLSLKELLELYCELHGATLNVEWGARPYRQREVMRVWDSYELLPGWKPEIPLEVGLLRVPPRG